jgi:DNA helicase-2/ATP-dependent DNA helicase PcrA
MPSSWLDELNPAQQAAATCGDGPLLVIAGAGTGKTMTLAARVAYLLEQGVRPERILLLTFTRRAAAEMLRRARGMSGRPGADNVWGGTFHAVANRLLRIHGRALNLSPDFTVIDQADAADMMSLIRSELGLASRERRFPRKETLVSIYSRTVNAQEKLRGVLDVHYPWCAGEIEGIAQVFEQYGRRKLESYLLDYDDLLLHWDLLCQAPGVGDKVADRFDHILVDEYQDTNAVQAQILLGMRKHSNNIMVVGDDAQSIYSFRAATIRNILDFPEQFPGTRIIKLEQNYRSTLPILAASNAVMAAARERYTKELWSERPSDQKPVLLTCVDEAEQSDVVCRQVLEHLEQGIPLQRQAVLFRAGHHSAALEIELARRNIPFHKYGGLRFIEMAHIKDMLAVLRIVENPFDQVSWFRVLQLLDGIGPRTARRIMSALGIGRAPAPTPDEQGAASRMPTPLRSMLAEPPDVPPAARQAFAELGAALAYCCGVLDKPPAKGKRGGSAPPVTSQIERARRFYQPLLERKYDNWRVRQRDLEQLEQIAARYRSRARFITDLTLDPPTSTSDLAGAPYLDEDFLILSTMHSAKGLEWDAVHILHAADGMIPSDMATGDEAGLEEERRLFYVGMTRAKDWLYVYFPLRYYRRPSGLSDKHHYAQLTRFISDPVRALFEQQTSSAPIDTGEQEPFSPHGVQARLKQLWTE